MFLVKEIFQLVALVLNLRKGKALDGALMSGKICTTVLFVSLIIMVLFPALGEQLTDVITGICLIFMLIAFVDYIRAYYGKNKKLHDM